MKNKPLFSFALFCACFVPVLAYAAPAITVSASAVSLLGTGQPISISVTLIDPNATGMLRVSGTGIVPIASASTVTPGATATVGPIYGNDVIIDGFGNVNATYYKVQVFTVTNGIIASTPSLQNFYAFIGSGTIDLATATPLAPSFMTGTGGSVSVPGALSVTGPLSASSATISGGTNFGLFSRDVRLDGVKADGSTDDSTAFNLSITNADGNKQGHIMLPCGAIKVNSAINLTNKNGLTLEGCASDVFDFGTPLQNTEIDCNTGGICIDLTGSSSIRLKNISLKMANAFTNPSTVGILDGRDNAASPSGSGQFCFSQYNTLENVNILSSSNSLLNGGRGYIGIYNIGAEHFDYLHGKVQTDDPLVFATTNVLSISSPYQTIATGCPASMSGAYFRDVSTTPLSWTGGTIEIWNGVEFNLGLDSMFECTMGTTAGQCVVTEGTLVNQVKGHIHVETPTANGSCLGINATTNNNLFLFCNVGAATGSAAYVNFDSNNLTVNDSSVWAVNETGTAQLMFGNAATGSVWNGGHIDLGNSLSPLSLSNLTLTGTVVQARAFTSGNVTFSGTSQYGLFASDGTKLLGNIAVNTAPITSSGFVIKGSNQTGTFQQGLQVFPTLSGTSQSIGVDIQANVTASITQALNAGVIVETPTINAGGVITEWDGVRVSAAPAAGTQCSLKLFGSTSGSTCFNPTATASGIITFPAATGTVALAITATSAAFATATTAGTCVQSTTAVAGATTAMAATASPVSTPGVGAVWSAFVSSAGNVTINECAVAASAGGSIAFNIRVTP